jgi:cytochrome c5
MWLGISFVLLGVIATILQAWLWSFPMVPDPGGPDPNGKSTAPRLWTSIHRVIGLAFVLIYVLLMVEMVPRLWEYQVELPARTVMHAVMGLLIGILLVAKIAIIRWFQHFGKALPSIGLGIMACTIILATLSVPFALKAHDFGDTLSAENVVRVKRSLHNVEWVNEVEVDALIDRLVTEESMEEGIETLTKKCVACHDMRTILAKPRSAQGWYSVNLRMVKKPTLGERLYEHEIPAVTAYLVAITPDLQESVKLKKSRQEKQQVEKDKMDQVVESGSEKPPLDMEQGKELLVAKCTDCHEMEEVDAHGKDDADGWKRVVDEMISEYEAELTADEARIIVAYLAATRGK